MKQILFACAVFVAMFGTAAAHQFTKGTLVIAHPWTRATPSGTTVGAGYLTITNNGKVSDRLTGGTFEGADHVEVHQMKTEGDKMMMRHLSDGLEIMPGETVKFTPGSYHLMFTGLKKPIVLGPNVKGTLIFDKAGAVEVTYKVESMGAATSQDNMHEHMHKDGMDHGEAH